MRLIALALCLTLPACATTRVGESICRNRGAVEMALNVAMVRAQAIADPVKREAAVGAVNVSLAALGRCS